MSSNKKVGIPLAIATIFGIPLILLVTALLTIPGIKIGTLIGIAAYSFMLANILFATYGSKLGSMIGFKKITLWHVGTATGVIVFAITHKVLMNVTEPGLVSIIGNIAFWLLMAVFIFSFLFMSNLPRRVSFLQTINQKISRNFKIWLHRLNIVATIMIFFHVILNGFIRTKVIFLTIFSIISIIVFVIYFKGLYQKLKAAKAN